MEVIVSQVQIPDGNKYVQSVPDGKCLCLDSPRRKDFMSRLSCVLVQTFVSFWMSLVSRLCHFECTTPPPPYTIIFNLYISDVVWDNKLGYSNSFIKSPFRLRITKIRVVEDNSENTHFSCLNTFGFWP